MFDPGPVQDLLCHRSAVEAASRRQRTDHRATAPLLSVVKERMDLTNAIGPQPLNVTLTWMTVMTAVNNPMRSQTAKDIMLDRSLAAGARNISE